ncbi:MAG: D-aminoacyl-tRNA deacylase [Anaerolineae bacterium]|jgi:D-tyrosyl-tRNA(Tyr) deacylase|nr:D-aminoacyl-tRNA deacylase [Anaerolineae bacterium]
MRVILQRVSRGSVTVDGQVVGQVGLGYVALVGVAHADTPDDAALLAKKTAVLRVFEDEAGKMNKSILEVGGGVLAISQFTLYADLTAGRRPSFIGAARPEHALPLFDHYVACLRQEGVASVATGVFGAMMQVEIHNDGPVTLTLDSADFRK